jgi:lipopolysaccharide cholinephosphotransferase
VVNFDDIFPDVRASGETLTRQCQLVMLRMLKVMHYICEKHGIEYFLVGGSLLGAIRHKGFIPWDDDLDVGMTRENYEKFVQHAVVDLPGDIFFQTHATDKAYPSCGYVEARLRDKYSSYRNGNGLKKSSHQGLHVDIFVYDRAFLPRNIFIITENVLMRVLLRDDRRRARVLKFISKYSPVKLVYASSYLQNFGMWKFGANYIRRDEIEQLVKTTFEDMEAFVPVGWKKCLERQYGDFMQLPPVEQQKGHHTITDMPDPFTPCEHAEVLNWKDRETTV